jgi:hypothetical protein
MRQTAATQTAATLFKGPRPQITSLAARYWTHGAEKRITVNQKIVSVELIRPAATTHESDPNQRSVALPMTRVREPHRAERDHQPQHGAAGLVHAVRGQRERRPVGRQMGPCRQSRGEPVRKGQVGAPQDMRLKLEDPPVLAGWDVLDRKPCRR